MYANLHSHAHLLLQAPEQITPSCTLAPPFHSPPGCGASVHDIFCIGAQTACGSPLCASLEGNPRKPRGRSSGRLCSGVRQVAIHVFVPGGSKLKIAQMVRRTIWDSPAVLISAFLSRGSSCLVMHPYCLLYTQRCTLWIQLKRDSKR
jgi:hypothetical protein